MAKGVTYERILNARSEPHNWLTYYGAYDGQRYSPLDQINKENVKRIAPEWVFQGGSVGLHSGKSTHSFEASPLVVDGVMFVSGWDGWVWALDARNGDSCGSTGMRSRSTCRSAAATNRGSQSPRAWSSWSP